VAPGISIWARHHRHHDRTSLVPPSPPLPGYLTQYVNSQFGVFRIGARSDGGRHRGVGADAGNPSPKRERPVSVPVLNRSPFTQRRTASQELLDSYVCICVLLVRPPISSAVSSRHPSISIDGEISWRPPRAVNRCRIGRHLGAATLSHAIQPPDRTLLIRDDESVRLSSRSSGN